MSRKKRKKKTARTNFLKLEQREYLREAPNPNWEKVTTNRIRVSHEWLKDLVRRNLTALTKVDIPESAYLDTECPHPTMVWESEPIPCEAPPDEDEDEDEDCCDECGSPECQGECMVDDEDYDDADGLN